MVVIVLEKVELPVVRNVAHGQRLGVRLIPTHDQTADLLLEIGAPVRVADGRRVGGQPRHRLGHDILVADGLKRHLDPRHRAHLPRPLPGAVDDDLTADLALRGLHPGDPVARHGEPRHPHALEDLRAMHPRALGKALGDVGGARLPVRRQPACADQIADLHQRPHPLHLIGGDQMHLHPEGPRGGGQPLVFGPAVLIGGQPEAAGHLPAGLKPRLRRQLLVEVDGVFQHPRDRGGRTQLPHQPRRVPGGPGGELPLLQQHDLGLVVAGQVIGGRTPDDPAADDDDPGVAGQGHGRIFP